MPIGPHSAGILPGGSDFAPVISPVAPVMNAATASGLAVNSNGSLVSFLPEVTDWYSPFEQATAVQTLTDHPCQNGGGCGCGGTCVGKDTSKIGVEPPFKMGPRSTSEMKVQMSQMITRIRAEMTEDDWNGKVLRTQPGVGSVHNAITPDGRYFTSVSEVDVNRNIQVTVKEIGNDQILVNSKFIWNGDGWNPANQKGTGASIPATLPLDSFTIAALATGIVNSNIVHTLSSGNNCDSLEENPSPNADCIIHDLVCTSPTEAGLPPIFTSDQKHIIFWAPFIGSYSVDISSCCFNHDIACWCAHNLGDVMLANFNVINCVLESIIAGAWTALGQELSHMSGLKRVLGSIIGPALVAAWQILLLTGDISGVPLLAVLYAAFNVGYDGFLYDWLTKNPCYANFDHSHDDSCLCGGTKPTVQCSNNNKWTGYDGCVDICKLAGDSENCFNCGWVCDGLGYAVWTPDAPSGQYCCPGTGTDCISESSTPAPNCCISCNWNCNQATDGSWFWALDPSQTGANCCNSAPSYSVDAGSGVPATGQYCGCNYVWYCDDGGVCQLAAGGPPGSPDEISLGIGEGTLVCGNNAPPQPTNCC